MKFALRFVSSTSACFELINDTAYYSPSVYSITLDGKPLYKNFNTNVFSLFGLKPGVSYVAGTAGGDFSLEFSTLSESACLDVCDFPSVQAALDACPPDGRVFVPAGIHRTGPLVLGSDTTLELAAGAVLLAETDPAKFPVWPGEIKCGPDGDVLQISSWEGEPRPCHQSIISAHRKHNIRIVGEGIIDGDAQNSEWWREPKKRSAGRPRMLFLNDCERVYMHGITVKNSPAWNLHPFFSRDLGFYDIAVEAPADSPNTDGCNPESCDDVKILGVRFSVGDDAVAIKSGKLYMGAKYKTPASRYSIRNCLMERAHGGVVIGSEIGGGVRELSVRQCFFSHTDRGLRVKTRRGRGKDSTVDGIIFENIVMENVLTPLVINMYYDRDPDGVCEYVWSREKLPVDDRTPYLGQFTFKNIVCENCEYAAGYFDGLPEQPIAGVTLENVSFSVSSAAGSGYPAMMTHIDPYTKRGLIFRNVNNVALNNVSINGHAGEAVSFENVVRFSEEQK